LLDPFLNGAGGWNADFRQPTPRSAALVARGRSGLSLLDRIDALQIPVEFTLKFFAFVVVEELPQIFVRVLRILI
jgi:hypothetical protein